MRRQRQQEAGHGPAVASDKGRVAISFGSPPILGNLAAPNKIKPASFTAGVTPNPSYDMLRTCHKTAGKHCYPETTCLPLSTYSLEKVPKAICNSDMLRAECVVVNN